MPEITLYHWLAFGLFVTVMLVLDLCVFHRHSRETTLREAALWTAIWASMALAFNGFIWWWQGSKAALEFLTGYLIEWSLSMDNVFVFAVVFAFFGVPAKYQYRVLFWGILGAVFMRLTFVLAGAQLIEHFSWTTAILGAFLIYTGIKLAVAGDEEVNPEHSWVLKTARRIFPVATGLDHGAAPQPEPAESHEAAGQDGLPATDAESNLPDVPTESQHLTPRRVDHGQKFFVRENGRLCITPLFLVLLVIESTDVMFAVDSVPAIFGVTKNTFIVFTSNIFAILGLRALYFLLAGVMDMFRYLKYGLSAILVFVGCKMTAEYFFGGHGEGAEASHLIPPWASLLVILLLLGLAIVASIIAQKRHDAHRPDANAAEKATVESSSEGDS